MVKITIIPTTNAEIINAVVNHPDILPGAVDGDSFTYREDPDDIFCLVVCSGILCGVGRATLARRGSYECHAMLYREWRGEFAIEAGKRFNEWLFTNTDANSVFTYVSDRFRYGAAFCVGIGLKRVGVMRDFLESNGGIYNATIYGATRQDLGLPERAARRGIIPEFKRRRGFYGFQQS